MRLGLGLRVKTSMHEVTILGAGGSRIARGKFPDRNSQSKNCGFEHLISKFRMVENVFEMPFLPGQITFL